MSALPHRNSRPLGRTRVGTLVSRCGQSAYCCEPRVPAPQRLEKRLVTFRHVLLLFAAGLVGLVPPTGPVDLRADDPASLVSTPESKTSAPPVPAAADVDAWVRQLDSNRRTERLAAEERLLRAGPAILPFLPEGRSRPQGHPLTRIVEHLERARALSALEPLRLPPPTPLTVAGEIQSLTAAGVRLDAGQLSAEQLARPVEPGSQNSTLWGRYSALLDVSQVHALPDALPHHLRLVPGLESRPIRGAAAGPFWVEVEARGTRRIAGTSDTLARLTVSTRTQPGLRGLITFAGVDDLHVTDAKGLVLPAFSPGTRIEQFWEREDMSPPLAFDVRWPAETQGPLSVRGHSDVLVAAAMVPFEFRRVLRGPPTRGRPLTQSRAGIGLSLEQVSLLPRNAVEVRCEVTLPAEARLFESHQWAALPWTAQFLGTSEGEPPRLVSQTGRGDWDIRADGTLQLTSRFEGVDPVASDWTLNVELPSLIARRKVSFAVELPCADSTVTPVTDKVKE